MAFPEDSQLTSGMMEDTEPDDGFVQVKEKLGNSNEKTRRLGDSNATGNCVSFTDQLETNSGPGIREPSDMDWSGNSGQSNLNVQRATSYRLSKDRESDQYELLRKKLEQIEEDISKHTDPSEQLIEERARVVRRLQWCKSKMNLKKGNHDRPSIARNLHTTKPEDEDHLKGLWKCKVATALDKDMVLKLARFFEIEASLIKGSPVPGLKLLEQIEKKDCQGCNWEAFTGALTTFDCRKALATFHEHYKGSPPASVNHNPVSFQYMVAAVEGMLNTSDAVQIATCFGFNVSEIEETEKHGSQFVIELLQVKGKFDVRNVTLFRKVLKKLDLIQAANRVSLYEDHLKLPVLKVTLDEASSSDESRCYFDDVTTALTDETERMDNKEPTAKLMHHLQETYDMPLEDIEKGSIILSLRVKTKKSLERLKSDVKSGKFSKDCSKILFPNADNLYSINDEICLRATCAVEEFERVYQELKRMEDEQQEQLVTVVVADDGAEQEKTEVLKVSLDEASSSDESRCYFDDVITAVTDETKRMDDKEPTAKLMHHLQEIYDMPLEDIGKGSIILSLRVNTKKTLERLKSDVKSGKFSKDCSIILSPYADKLYGTNGEICLRATCAVEEFERVYQELKRMDGPVETTLTLHDVKDLLSEELTIQDCLEIAIFLGLKACYVQEIKISQNSVVDLIDKINDVKDNSDSTINALLFALQECGMFRVANLILHSEGLPSSIKARASSKEDIPPACICGHNSYKELKSHSDKSLVVSLLCNSCAAEWFPTTESSTEASLVWKKNKFSYKIPRELDLSKLKHEQVKDVNELQRGDHIVFRRLLGYDHHAIFLHKSEKEEEEEKIKVIQWTGPPVLIKCEDIRFPKGGVRRVQYPESDHADVVVARAYNMLFNSSQVYHLANNNCESLAVFCKIGNSLASQGEVVGGILPLLPKVLTYFKS